MRIEARTALALVIVCGFAAAASAEAPEAAGAASAQLERTAALSADRAGNFMDGKLASGTQAGAVQSAGSSHMKALLNPAGSPSLRGQAKKAPPSGNSRGSDGAALIGLGIIVGLFAGAILAALAVASAAGPLAGVIAGLVLVGLVFRILGN